MAIQSHTEIIKLSREPRQVEIHIKLQVQAEQENVTTELRKEYLTSLLQPYTSDITTRNI